MASNKEKAKLEMRQNKLLALATKFKSKNDLHDYLVTRSE